MVVKFDVGPAKKKILLDFMLNIEVKERIIISKCTNLRIFNGGILHIKEKELKVYKTVKVAYFNSF